LHSVGRDQRSRLVAGGDSLTDPDAALCQFAHEALGRVRLDNHAVKAVGGVDHKRRPGSELLVKDRGGDRARFLDERALELGILGVERENTCDRIAAQTPMRTRSGRIASISPSDRPPSAAPT
jgi:hypothetical protein